MGRHCRIENNADLHGDDLRGVWSSVEMGQPRFGWEEIPLADAMDTLKMAASWEDRPAPAAGNVGNPHVIFFCEDLEAMDCGRLGPMIETDPLFPERVNVNFAQVIGENHIRLIVWERDRKSTRLNSSH